MMYQIEVLGSKQSGNAGRKFCVTYLKLSQNSAKLWVRIETESFVLVGFPVKRPEPGSW